MSRFLSVHNSDVVHYNIFKTGDCLDALKEMFPDGETDEMNFVLFSTSGIHGTYQTIEDEEKAPGVGVTFLIVHPRIVTLRYGVVYPETKEDFEYLKKLRKTSKRVVNESIG